MTYRILNWIGYQLVIYGGKRTIDPFTRFGRWCLVRAGNHAYELRKR